MNNFNRIANIFEDYSKSHNIDFPDNFISDLITTSYDSDNTVNVYNSTENNLPVLNLDVFAQKIYYKVFGENKSDNALKSPDAFLVNCENHWYFIEFKNQGISASKSKAKNSVIQKALCIIYSMVDVLYETRGREILDNYRNPLDFFRSNVTYILVCSSDKNPKVADRNINQKNISGQYRYTPEFMQKLVSYLFFDAYIYTEQYFEKEFVKHFKY